ncbi:MAG: hypothetical protein ACYSW7_10520 [Planctomycetota bacterium]|jgi:hypothetical protein
MKYNIVLRWAQQFPAIPVWLLGLVLSLGLPAMAGAIEEGIPCPPEPTNMDIEYGDLVTCSIDVIGDTDVFRFLADGGEKVVVQASKQGGTGTPCIELFDPEGTPIGSDCSSFGARIDTGPPLAPGWHTILVTEQLNNDTVDYALALERIVPPSPTAQPIQYDESISDQINPVGDVDLFFFEGSVGDSITVQASRQGGTGTPCIELFAPDGTLIGSDCSSFGARIDAMLDQEGTHTILITEQLNNDTVDYELTLQCLGGHCLKFPYVDLDLEYTDSTLTITFDLFTQEPTTLNLWLSVLNVTIPVWSIPLPTIDPPISIPIPIPGFPSLGTIGVLTTLTTPEDGIILSDWETVDTGPIPIGAVAPTEEELRRLF